ncbi:hypothetical protein [Pseudomonas costantinii]|uniref:hypothetical protein n=1 Tax=Pseudomonas costantinii TaxID=168469 RepID=UPI0015A1EA6B|nr:hypothetical protein [Pseudomonas costantinii]NVZ71273.1 hypothetical protein [Pseudomonas costantinii]
MSTQLKLASDIPQARIVPGNVEGTIGEHPFETQFGEVTLHDGTVQLKLGDRHDGPCWEEVFLQFSDSIKQNEELPLETQNFATLWISFINPDTPHALQCTQGVLLIEHLVLSPFSLQGYISGTTESSNDPVNIKFDLRD